MAHNRRVLVFKDLNYGASKTSATQNTAANPADLQDGSVGIYGIHEAGSTNLNKLVLITDGGSETAGFISAASFVGKEVFIAQGTAANVRLSAPISLFPNKGIMKSSGAKYSAPVRGEIRLGYNGTAGSLLNLPPSILRGDDFSLSIFNKNYPIAGSREPGQKVLLSVQTALADGQYAILGKWVVATNKRTDEILIGKNTIKILHNGTGAVFTTSATVAAVNGATTLTTSAAHGVTAGDAISLDSDYYVTIAGTTGSTLVLDRAYQGPTATISNVNTLDITGAATQFGLAFKDGKDFLNLSLAAQGIAQNATIKYQTASSPGTGSNAEVILLEKDALGKKGTEDQITRYQPLDLVYSQVSGLNYDLYFFEVQNANHPKGDLGAVFKVLNYIHLAFVQNVADTTNFNQSDFEDAMGSLFGTTFIPQISA